MKIVKFFAYRIVFYKIYEQVSTSYEPIVFVHKCSESWCKYEILFFEVLMNGLFNSCSLWKAGKVHLMVWLHSEAWLGEPMLHMIRAKDVATYHVGGRSLTT
jgi:hypothetical protein